MSLCSLQDTMKYFILLAAPFNKLPHFYVVSILNLNSVAIFHCLSTAFTSMGHLNTSWSLYITV